MIAPIKQFRKTLRLLCWTTAIAWAACFGAVARYWRRLLQKPPRIWRGPNGLHLVKWPVLVDEAAGFSSRSVIYTTKGGKYALFHASDFTRVLDSEGVVPQDWPYVALIDLLLNADIWVPFFDSLLFKPQYRRTNSIIIRSIKLLGIKVIPVTHGMDVFYLDRRTTRFGWVQRAQADYPTWDLAEHEQLASWRTRLWCQNASYIVSADSTTDRFIPKFDISFKWFPVDCDLLRPAERKSNAQVKIIHAPQHRHIKGTQYLIDSVNTLQSLGFQCELELIENVPRDVALKLYAEADIIADQFCMGAFGMFALEGLALGKPVLTYLDQEHLGNPFFNLPIVNANRHNLCRVLAALVSSSQLRERLGHEARKAVEKYQSVTALAQVWHQIYDHVWWGKQLALEKTTHFNTDRQSRSYTEDPSRPEFWPVHVLDLAAEIESSVRIVYAAE